MQPLISVVISTYKREKELIRAIDSVLAQTYKNIEIIVVDDNGKNNEFQIKTEKIMKKYSEYRNIKYIPNEKNLGGALARNIGIENCSGEYIAFLDDDDQYYENKLKKQIELFNLDKSGELALVYCYTESYDENNKKLREYNYDFVGNCLVEAMTDCIAATSQWLCKKEYLNEVNNFSNVPSKQDSTVIIKLLNKGYKVDRVKEVLVRYNEHSGPRISGNGEKNINGELLLREYCRRLYYKVTSSDILNIEKSFSYRLSKLYALNNMNEMFKQELNILKKIDKKLYLKRLIYFYIIRLEKK
ncbi:glycosyltransferase family 2 protein [Clostridium sp.]|uniref:glycosyltransferase family 2 protein n=1 Tax=Clostridium sp. TaxID=1506 RepID=UPI003522E9D6